MTWPCFLIEPTGACRRWLRRYSARYRETAPYDLLPEYRCPACASGCHDAEVRIEDGPDDRAVIGDTWAHDDPRWPTACACGYRFAERDAWQLFREAIYVGPDGHEHTMRERPVGAMLDATWLHHIQPYRDRSPDGRVLMVRLPGGDDWIIDDKSQNGAGWTRTGEPPMITASPSILTPHYHGFLQSGMLTADLDGRQYPPTEVTR